MAPVAYETYIDLMI